MSLLHKNEENNNINKEKKRGAKKYNRTIINTLIINLKKLREVRKGQGLPATTWNGLNFFILLFSPFSSI